MNHKENSMGRDDIINSVQAQLGDHVLAFQRKSGQRAYLDIAPQAVEQATQLLLGEFGARFMIATGVDTSAGFEVMYHWALDEKDFVITLRVLVTHESPELKSIALICPAAEWIEREMWELLGIQFIGHPDMRHLLLSDDWPEGNYPMRRNHGATS